MKIAIVAPSPVPFLIGGAEKLFWGMHRYMNQLTPHEVELIKVPCRDQEFWPLMESYERFGRLDLSHFDRVITTKYPAWMVYHRNHHLYMQHTCRGVYDLYRLCGKPLEFVPNHRALEPLCRMLQQPRPDRSLLDPFLKELFFLRERADLPPDTFAFPGPLTRAVIHWLDRLALSPEEIQTYSAISKNVTNREGYFPPGVDIEVIHHPSDLEGLHSTGYQYLFTASRLEELKRMDLLVEAFKSVDAEMEFRIAGTGGQEERLKQLAAKDRRIRFLGFVPDAEMVGQYAGALCVPFVPYDEDYGLITLEAMLSSKAVLTTLDSGGVNELVRDGVNGRAVPPEKDAIAAAMQDMIAHRDRTMQMGVNGRESVLPINWHNTVSALLREEGTRPAAVRVRRKKIVGTTTFSIYPPVGGGQKRIYHLYRELAPRAECVFVALSGNPSSQRVTLSQGFVEISVPRSQKLNRQIGELQSHLKASVDDIAAIDGYRLCPGYREILRRECADAEVVVASHPYLYHAVRDAHAGRLWYEAQNVEFDLKAAILPDSPRRDEYLERVREVECQCARDAERILSVSDEDKNRLMALYGVDEEKILIVRNGMDFSTASRSRLHHDEKRGLRERLGFGNGPVALFMGSYHGPNIEALGAIKEIARQCPAFLFLIMGSVCNHEEADQVPVNVKPLGVLDEDEKNVLLNAADIALNPILSGSGSNLKLLEYIAYGIPVITTPHGNRGYGLEDKEHLLVAEVEAFPAILRDFHSADLSPFLRMAEKARQFAASRYDWPVIAAPLADFF
jgi:glycosyltransferase involved in cell wall biosynthesis